MTLSFTKFCSLLKPKKYAETVQSHVSVWRTGVPPEEDVFFWCSPKVLHYFCFHKEINHSEIALLFLSQKNLTKHVHFIPSHCLICDLTDILCRWFCNKTVVLHHVDQKHSLYEKCICIFKHSFEFWNLLAEKKRKTELKLEMEQNVWQSSQKLIYPLKSETVIKLKLKKSLNFCFFFNVSTTENWQ